MGVPSPTPPARPTAPPRAVSVVGLLMAAIDTTVVAPAPPATARSVGVARSGAARALSATAS